MEVMLDLEILKSESYNFKIPLFLKNLSINKGKLIVFSAPSGSGKTTLLKILSGLLNPISGSIIVNKKNS